MPGRMGNIGMGFCWASSCRKNILLGIRNTGMGMLQRYPHEYQMWDWTSEGPAWGILGIGLFVRGIFLGMLGVELDVSC